MSTRYVFRRTTTVTVTMADPGEVIEDSDGGPGYVDPDGPKTAEERDESAREWAEQALPLDDYAEDFVTVEHGPVELLSQEPAGEENAEEPVCSSCGGTRLQSSGHGYRPCHCSPYTLERDRVEVPLMPRDWKHTERCMAGVRKDVCICWPPVVSGEESR